MSCRWCSASSSKPDTSPPPPNSKKKQTKTCLSLYSPLTQTIGLHKKKLLKIIEKYVRDHPSTLSNIGQEDDREEENGHVGKRKGSQASLTQNPKKAKKTKQQTDQEDEEAADPIEAAEQEPHHNHTDNAKPPAAHKPKNLKPAPQINTGMRQQTNSDYSRPL